jgi:hypothetical protein
MFSKVWRSTMSGRVIKPTRAGEEPKWTTELNIAKLLWFCLLRVPMTLALLNPDKLLIS